MELGKTVKYALHIRWDVKDFRWVQYAPPSDSLESIIELREYLAKNWKRENLRIVKITEEVLEPAWANEVKGC